MKRGPDASAGFSLVETLVALVIVGLLAALGSQGIWQARQIQERFAAAERRLEEEEKLRQWLMRTLGSVTPPKSEDDGAVVGLRGSSAAMEFVAPLPQSVFRGATARYALIWRHLPSGDLTVSWAPSAGGQAETTDSILLADASDLSFSYFGPSAADSSDWFSQWDRHSLPQIVRVQWGRGRDRHDILIRVATAAIECSAGLKVYPRICFE
jgi:prepilin-type N-terminal cleavage/methylation domain-containing protein